MVFVNPSKLHRECQHLALDMYMLLQAFIVEANRELGGAVAYYSNIGNPYSIAKDATYITQTLVGDSFIVSLRLFSS